MDPSTGLNLGNKTVTHSFLIIPDSPYPLLGRDLLHKLRATISFSGLEPHLDLGQASAQALSLTLPQKEAYRLFESLSSGDSNPFLQQLINKIP